MKPFLTFVGLFLCISLSSYSQIVTENENIEIRFYTPSIVRVLKSPIGANIEKVSLSVILEPQTVKVKTTQKGDVLRLKSDDISVSVNVNTGQISFYSRDGKLLLQEKDSRVKDVFQSFTIDKSETLYGLGQLQNGKMSQRNQSKYMIQGNTEDFIPFIQSVKGYGIFWDNYSPTLFSDNEEETSFASEVGDCIDYYFMFGGDADGVVAQMRHLTGEVPMFPLWTYGFFQSKERYKSQKETVGVVEKYRELGVPLDGIIQDWQYWGHNYLWNAMTFLNPEFPNPKKMIDDIHGMNAHIVISIWSSFGPQTLQYRELDSLNLLFDFRTWPPSGLDVWPPNMKYPSGVKPYDPYSSQARDIYWKYLNNGLFSLGMDGWWMDSTEPDHLDFKESDLDIPTSMGPFRKVRNAYPLMTVGGVYDHQRAVSSEKRVFILTRSAFAGQQRYGSNVWTGDVQASWKTLKDQIPAGLNFSLCAIPHWNTDIGGFFLNGFPKKLKDPEYRELYARWLQFGAFCPMMRSHGADAPREIYQFGSKGEPVYDAIEKFIRLRYSFLPYIYSTSWDVSANRSTFMRALVMDFAGDKKVWDINDEYMFGKSLLVCPVTDPLSKTSEKSVYLPKGKWFDFWTNQKMDGGATISRDVPLDIMPIYVKAGSIIPIGPDVQYSTQKSWDDLEIRVYPGANGSFTLYEDEFDNYNYENGDYSTIPFSWNESTKTLTIGDRTGTYKGMISQRKFHIVNIAGKSSDVTYEGKKMKITLP